MANGYWFYVSGWIPLNKDPEAVDRKLIERYGIDISKWGRARRKRVGFANLHCLRHGRTFVLSLLTRTEQKFGSFARSSLWNCIPGLAGFICRSNAVVFAAVCSLPVSLARLSVNVSAIRNSIGNATPVFDHPG